MTRGAVYVPGLLISEDGHVTMNTRFWTGKEWLCPDCGSADLGVDETEAMRYCLVCGEGEYDFTLYGMAHEEAFPAGGPAAVKYPVATQAVLAPADGPWMEVSADDPRARALADRHYSRKTPGARKFMGPGETMVLITYDGRAVFGWRRQKFREDGQEGVECCIFRNEGPLLSSDLVREAERMALARWPGTRFFTYIDAKKVRPKRDPGRCFRKAGWKVCGRSIDKGLVRLEKRPQRVQ